MSYTTSVLLRTQVYLYLLNISLGFCVLSVENETKKDQQQRQKGTGQSWEVPHGTAETDLFRSLLDEMMKLLVCHLPTLGLQFSWSCCGNSVEGQHISWKNPCQRNTCSAESWVGGTDHVIVPAFTGSAPSLRIVRKQDERMNNVLICSQLQRYAVVKWQIDPQQRIFCVGLFFHNDQSLVRSNSVFRFTSYENSAQVLLTLKTNKIT